MIFLLTGLLVVRYEFLQRIFRVTTGFGGFCSQKQKLFRHQGRMFRVPVEHSLECPEERRHRREWICVFPARSHERSFEVKLPRGAARHPTLSPL